MTRSSIRHWLTQRRAEAARLARAALQELKLRYITILVGLGLVWLGLSAIYRPLAPLVVGAFLLWYTTIRRIAK